MRGVRIVTLGVTTMAALAVAGCNDGGSSDDSTSSAPTHAATSPTAAASSAAPGGTATGGKKIAVNLTITDPVMGDRVTVTRAVRDFPVPASMSAVSDREIVLVDVTATAGSKYYAGWQTTQLAIVVNGEENQESETDSLDAAMKQAGYAPLGNDGNVDTGKTGSGWVPFVVDPKDSPTLTLRMKRTAATTSDGKTIAAKNFDVPLVK